MYLSPLKSKQVWTKAQLDARKKRLLEVEEDD